MRKTQDIESRRMSLGVSCGDLNPLGSSKTKKRKREEGRKIHLNF
jgi:hypothetical protein